MKLATLPLGMVTVTLALVSSSIAIAQDFTYDPPGQLVPGSGEGRVDYTVYVPGMRFPIEVAPAYVNSQVWGNGGMNGPGGGQCDAVNYSYPWKDNFCEVRSWTTPMCPTGEGHQGEDIRPSTCDKDVHWAVAAEDGTITNIGTYSLALMTPGGTRHNYLHMEPSSLLVSVGDTVQRGERIGRVSNSYGGTPTTIHLHYEQELNVAGIGNTKVPPYMSLVAAYEELLGVPTLPCAIIPPAGATLDDGGPCSRFHGPPTSWRHVTDAGNGGDLHWTYAFEDADPGNWAEWLLNFEQAGDYEVEVNTLSAYAQSTLARYVVRHAGEEVELRVDQSTEGWHSLGTFAFAADGDQFVAVYDNTGELLADKKMIMFDAVRLTRAATPEAGPEPGPEPEPDAAPPHDAASVEDATFPVPDTGSASGNPGDYWTSDGDEGCSCRMPGHQRRASHRGSAMWLALAAGLLTLTRLTRRGPRLH